MNSNSMEIRHLIKIEKIYSENEDFLKETMKHEHRQYKAVKDKEFVIKINFLTEDFLRNHQLKVDLVQDVVEKGYPIVDQNKRMMEYIYQETSRQSAIIKVIIHSITRSNQSIPFRILISSIAQINSQNLNSNNNNFNILNTNNHQINNNNMNNNNILPPQPNYSVLTDPIIVISRAPSKNKKMASEKINSNNNNIIINNNNNNNNPNNNNTNNNNSNNNQNNNMNNNNNNSNQPNLEEISKNIQKMMEMLQNQSAVLQKVSTSLENPKLETVYYQIDEPLKKKQRPQCEEDPYYLGQEPLQASIHSLINEYKEVPTKDKKQKRLRQLLFDLQREDKNLIREFAEDVLEIFNNPVTLQPNPPQHSPNFNSSYLEDLLFTNMNTDSENHFQLNQNNFPF